MRRQHQDLKKVFLGHLWPHPLSSGCSLGTRLLRCQCHWVSTLSERRYGITPPFLIVRTFYLAMRISNKETPTGRRRVIYQSEAPWLLPRTHLGINQGLRQEEMLDGRPLNCYNFSAYSLIWKPKAV